MQPRTVTFDATEAGKREETGAPPPKKKQKTPPPQKKMEAKSPPLHSPLSPPSVRGAAYALSSPTFRGLVARFLFCLCHRVACRSANVRCREEIQDRRAAPLVRENFRYLGAISA